jgi:catechol 2,3-dioxygenase-like lactoylglutathione lyase family enzyme
MCRRGLEPMMTAWSAPRPRGAPRRSRSSCRSDRASARLCRDCSCSRCSSASHSRYGFSDRVRPSVAILGVLETAIYARDLDAAEDLYSGVLGLEVESKEPGRHLFLRCGGGMVLVFDPEATARSTGPVPPHGATGPGHVAFAVDDLAAWPQRLRAAGVDIEGGRRVAGRRSLDLCARPGGQQRRARNAAHLAKPLI